MLRTELKILILKKKGRRKASLTTYLKFNLPSSSYPHEGSKGKISPFHHGRRHLRLGLHRPNLHRRSSKNRRYTSSPPSNSSQNPHIQSHLLMKHPSLIRGEGEAKRQGSGRRWRRGSFRSERVQSGEGEMDLQQISKAPLHWFELPICWCSSSLLEERAARPGLLVLGMAAWWLCIARVSVFDLSSLIRFWHRAYHFSHFSADLMHWLFLRSSEEEGLCLWETHCRGGNGSHLSAWWSLIYHQRRNLWTELLLYQHSELWWFHQHHQLQKKIAIFSWFLLN